MTFSLTVKSASEIEAEALAEERAGMRAFRRAFNLALADTAATGNLTAIYPSETTMLGVADAFADDSDAASLATALSITEAEVQAVQRARSDVACNRRRAVHTAPAIGPDDARIIVIPSVCQ